MERSRRRLVGKALLVLVWMYGNCTAVYLVLDPGWASARTLGVVCGIVVLAFDALYLGFAVRDVVGGEGGGYLLSKTEEGTARISLRAVHSSLLRRAREMEEVIGARVNLRRPSEKRLHVEVTYTTQEGREAIHVSESLRKALRERFEELVHPAAGFEVEFDAKLDGFAPSGTPAPPREKEREPFTGPRYPIE